MRSIPIASRVSGLWVCASFLHIPRQDALRTLSQFARVLESDGILYLAVKYGDGEAWVETSYGHRARRFFTFWLPAELDRLLGEAGFEILENWKNKTGKTEWLVRLAKKIPVQRQLY